MHRKNLTLLTDRVWTIALTLKPAKHQATLVHHYKSGFTLIELLIVLGILAILLASSVSNLMSSAPNTAVSQQAKQLQSLLSHARSVAIASRSRVFVCGATKSPESFEQTNETSLCDPHGIWSRGINIVLDTNNSLAVDSGDQIALDQPAIPGDMTLRWRGFRGKSHIEFLNSGSTFWQNGRFTLCVHSSPARSRNSSSTLPDEAMYRRSA